MHRWGLLATGMLVTAACATPKIDQAYFDQGRFERQVTIDGGRRLTLLCMGPAGSPEDRSPTVFIDNGATSDARVWYKVQPAIAKTARVCTYDRAGHRDSDEGPMPRDVLNVVKDMEALVKAADLSPPYVLVGGSLGGLHVRLFAARNRKDVAGILQVDPAVERWRDGLSPDDPMWWEMGAESPAYQRCTQALLARKSGVGLMAPCGWGALFWDADVQEFRRAVGSAILSLTPEIDGQELESASDLGDIPMIVLGHDAGVWLGKDPDPARRATEARWKAMERELATHSRQGDFREVPGANHMIMLDRPDVVIAAIEELVARAKP